MTGGKSRENENKSFLGEIKSIFHNFFKGHRLVKTKNKKRTNQKKTKKGDTSFKYLSELFLIKAEEPIESIRLQDKKEKQDSR